MEHVSEKFRDPFREPGFKMVYSVRGEIWSTVEIPIEHLPPLVGKAISAECKEAGGAVFPVKLVNGMWEPVFFTCNIPQDIDELFKAGPEEDDW